MRRSPGDRSYNLSKLDLPRLLDDPNQLVPNLNAYINGYSKNVREIMERFAFDQQIARMAEKNLLYEVIKKFAAVDLSPERVDNVQMGYVFEELIRIGAEQSNEEAGEHFTPREVIRLMVNLLLDPEKDLRKSHVVKTIYDPACGTGGMLSVAEKYIRDLNAEAAPHLFGQDWNDESWAVCKADMLIKGEDADNIILGDTFTRDGFDRDAEGQKRTPSTTCSPIRLSAWNGSNSRSTFSVKRRRSATRGASAPVCRASTTVRCCSCSTCWRRCARPRTAEVASVSCSTAHHSSRAMPAVERAISASGSSRTIGSKPVVALPDQLFYNTGISTYIWVLTNRKEARRKGKVQLIDARRFYVKMPKSLGNKRNKLGDPTDRPSEPDQIGAVTRIFGNFEDGETRSFPEEDPITKQPVEKTRVVSKVFDTADFGFHKITVERPLRLKLPGDDGADRAP